MSFAIVQSQSTTGSGSAASISATLGTTPTAPHLIVVMVQCVGGTGPTYTITDNHTPSSNAYTQVAHAVLNVDGTGNGESLDIWLLAPTAAQLNAGFAVTATPSVSGYLNLTVAEVSFAGSPPTAGTPQSAASGGASSTSISTPALSISTNSLVLYLASQFTVADAISPVIGSALYQHTYVSGTAIGFLSAYEANVATSATPSASMAAPATNWGIAGVALAENPITLTGPTTGPVGSASANFTVTPSASMAGVFTPTPVTGITFTPSTLTWAASSAAKTFTATAATAGTYPITGTFDVGYTLSGAPISYVASGGGGGNPTAATLAGPATGAIGQSTAYTVTLNTAATSTVTVTPASTIGGDTFQTSPSGGNVTTFTIGTGQTTGTFYVTTTSAGLRDISIATSPTLTYVGSPIGYAVGVATGYTISGATSAVVGITSAPITVTPNGFVVGTDTVRIGLTGVQGTLSNTSLSFTDTQSPQEITLNGSTSGAGVLAFTSALNLSIPTSPWGVTVVPASLAVTFVSILQAGAANTGLATTFTPTPLVYGGVAIVTPAGSTVGTVCEIGTTGTYVCTVTYQSSQLPAGSWPVVSWPGTGAVSGSDPQPIPIAATTTTWSAPYYRSVEVLY
jgi:hypothetical protein